jgi:hypothetical protein
MEPYLHCLVKQLASPGQHRDVRNTSKGTHISTLHTLDFRALRSVSAAYYYLHLPRPKKQHRSSSAAVAMQTGHHSQHR